MSLAKDETVEAVLAKLSADPATQATLAAVLAKLSADPSTSAKQDAANTALVAIAAYVDGIEALLGRLPTGGAASEATLAAAKTNLDAVLAKLSADPATQTTLAAVLAKLSADPATQATLAAVNAKLPAALVQGALSVARVPEVATRGTLTAAGQSITLAVPSGGGYGTVYFAVEPSDGTYVGLIGTFEASADNGTTWDQVVTVRRDATSSETATTTPAVGNDARWYAGAVPPNATNVRFRCTQLTSGTASVSVAVRAESPPPQAVAISTLPNVNLASGANNIGYVRAAGLWLDETATTLAGAGAFTSSARDFTGLATNTMWAGSTAGNTGAVEMRGVGVSDVAGVLALEISRDNTTFRRIIEVAATNSGTGGLYVATASYKPATRYARWVYTNGAAAQAHFMLQTFLLSA